MKRTKYYSQKPIPILAPQDNVRVNFNGVTLLQPLESADPSYPRETVIQLCTVLPYIASWYYITSYGRIFSSRANKYLVRDLNQNKYKTVTLSVIDGAPEDVEIEKLFNYVFGNDFVERFNDYRKKHPERNPPRRLI